MKYGKTLVKNATVTPFTKIGQGESEVFVFYKRESDGRNADFIHFEEKGSEKFLVLTKKDALNSWKMCDGRLVITDGESSAIEDVGFDKLNHHGFEIITRTNGAIFVYPDFEKTPVGWKKTGEENKNAASDLGEVIFAKYEPISALDHKEGGILSSEKIGSENGSTFYKLDLSELVEKLKACHAELVSASGKEILRQAQNDGGGAKNANLSDIFISLDYTGNMANLYEEKGGKRKLLLDHFYLGAEYPWEIGLKRFVESEIDFKNLILEIVPLKKNAEIYIEKFPNFDGTEIATLHSVSYEVERKFVI